MKRILQRASFVCVFCLIAVGQAAQQGVEVKEGQGKLRIEYVGFRPATYETKALIEPDNERPNKGGMVYVYLTNVTQEPIDLAFYRVNGKDESTWRLDGF